MDSSQGDFNLNSFPAFVLSFFVKSESYRTLFFLFFEEVGTLDLSSGGLGRGVGLGGPSSPCSMLLGPTTDRSITNILAWLFDFFLPHSPLSCLSRQLEAGER